MKNKTDKLYKRHGFCESFLKEKIKEYIEYRKNNNYSFKHLDSHTQEKITKSLYAYFDIKDYLKTAKIVGYVHAARIKQIVQSYVKYLMLNYHNVFSDKFSEKITMSKLRYKIK